MPTTPMYRVRTVVTGVAGSPYYIVGYFDASLDNAQACVDAWAAFVLPNPVDGLLGSLWTTEGDVQIVDPVSGDIVGIEVVEPDVKAGTTDYDQAPPTTQAVIRWRTGVYVAGREIRGRTNLPLQSEGSVAKNGTVNQVAQAAYNTRAQTLVQLDLVEHVIWSKKNGRWEQTVSGNCWEQFGVLRSRRD